MEEKSIWNREHSSIFPPLSRSGCQESVRRQQRLRGEEAGEASVPPHTGKQWQWATGSTCSDDEQWQHLESPERQNLWARLWGKFLHWVYWGRKHPSRWVSPFHGPESRPGWKDLSWAPASASLHQLGTENKTNKPTIQTSALTANTLSVNNPNILRIYSRNMTQLYAACDNRHNLWNWGLNSGPQAH